MAADNDTIIQLDYPPLHSWRNLKNGTFRHNLSGFIGPKLPRGAKLCTRKPMRTTNKVILCPDPDPARRHVIFRLVRSGRSRGIRSAHELPAGRGGEALPGGKLSMLMQGHPGLRSVTVSRGMPRHSGRHLSAGTRAPLEQRITDSAEGATGATWALTCHHPPGPQVQLLVNGKTLFFERNGRKGKSVDTGWRSLTTNQGVACVYKTG